jgi:hypothetical protein
MSSVQVDFANSSASTDGTNIRTMTVVWNSFQSATSYKVFFSPVSDVISNDGTAFINNDPSTFVPMNSWYTSGTMFTEQTDAIVGNSITYTFTNTYPKYSAFVYAYSDVGATQRISTFPTTHLNAVTVEPTNRRLYYVRTMYRDSNDTVTPIDASISTTPYYISFKSLDTYTPPSPVCFLGNAPVLTPSGYLRIDTLRVGDVVNTPTGTATIEKIHKKEYEAGPHSNPYIIPKGIHGATQRLLISPRHSVAVNGRMIEARDLGLKQEDRKGTLTYYNLGITGYSNMFVAGVEVESLAPITRVTITSDQFMNVLKSKYGGRITKEIKEACKFLADGSVSVPYMKR